MKGFVYCSSADFSFQICETICSSLFPEKICSTTLAHTLPFFRLVMAPKLYQGGMLSCMSQCDLSHTLGYITSKVQHIGSPPLLRHGGHMGYLCVSPHSRAMSGNHRCKGITKSLCFDLLKVDRCPSCQKRAPGFLPVATCSRD